MELDHLWPAIGGSYTSMGGIAWEEGDHADSSTRVGIDAAAEIVSQPCVV